MKVAADNAVAKRLAPAAHHGILPPLWKYSRVLLLLRERRTPDNASKPKYPATTPQSTPEKPDGLLTS